MADIRAKFVVEVVECHVKKAKEKRKDGFLGLKINLDAVVIRFFELFLLRVKLVSASSVIAGVVNGCLGNGNLADAIGPSLFVVAEASEVRYCRRGV